MKKKKKSSIIKIIYLTLVIIGISIFQIVIEMTIEGDWEYIIGNSIKNRSVTIAVQSTQKTLQKDFQIISKIVYTKEKDLLNYFPEIYKNTTNENFDQDLKRVLASTSVNVTNWDLELYWVVIHISNECYKSRYFCSGAENVLKIFETSIKTKISQTTEYTFVK